MRTQRRRIRLSNPLTHILLSCWVIAGVFFRVPAPRAAVPPAGYEILSRSTSQYLARGTRFVVFSNPILTPVGAYYRISLTPLGTVSAPAFSLSGFEGDSLDCRFELRNAGNVADSIEVTSSIVPPSTIGLGSVLFFHDSNANSEFDTGEDNRSFLNLAPGEGIDLSTLVVLSSGRGGGESFLAVRAEVGDETTRHLEESVVRIVTRAGPTNTLHVGPADNPKALPGGEGSPDDVARADVGLSSRSVVFENDVLNEGREAEVVQIEPVEPSGWPAGVDVAVLDTSGNELQTSSANPHALLLGQLDTGEKKRIQVRVTSRSESFYTVVDDSLSIRFRVRSLLDTTRVNETDDRVVLAEPFNAAAAVSLEQTFKENQAAFGDVVTFVTAVTNLTDSVRVDDVVVRETVQPTLDFLGSPTFEMSGSDIVWHAGPLAPGERRESVVKFVVNSRVSRGWTKITGDVRGTALARDVFAGPVVNVLKVDNDIFSDEGIILGDVFVDADKNGKRDKGDKGIPKVAVFLESGEYALTDSTGRFSIPRVFSGYRVVRIDEGTLPLGCVDMTAVSMQSNAAFGTERVVHLIPSGHAVVSFPLPPGTAELVPRPRAVSLDEHADSLSTRGDVFPTDRELASARAGEHELLGLIEPADRSVVTKKDQIEVAARVPLGSRFELVCNGKAVSEKQLGKKVIRLEDRVEELTYYGVKIESGWNTITLRAEPVDGSAPLVDSVTVALAGRPASITLSPERVILPADGYSTETIRVELRDEIGLPAINGLLATVVDGDSLVVGTDENPGQPGFQIASHDGECLLRVRPSSTTGRERIAVESHGVTASCLVAYVPPQRRMLLAGIIEGRLGAVDASGSGDPLGLENYDDGLRAGGESRFFVQGTAFAGINLTARVDSKKRYDDPLLKTDNPQTQYTIYGDASELHYAAPAQGGNYIALERGQSFLRYGDFRSPLTEGEFLAYKRSATGVEGAIVSGATGVNAFVTKTDFFTVRDEIPGDGTSGYYYLSRSPVVENSIHLVIEVRDRYQPEKVLEVTPLVEHRDFTVNYFNGAILMKQPVPAFSGELNPVMIVAIYEAESSNEGNTVYGVRGDLAGNGRFKLGASAVTEDGDGSDYALYGANGGVSLGKLDLSGEIARSEDGVAGEGSAYKLQLGAKNLRGEHSVYMRKVDGGFLNPSFAGSAHELFSEKAGFDSHLKLARDFSIDSHGHKHRFENTGEQKDNIDVFGKYEGSVFMLGGGVRAARQDRDGDERESLLSMVGAGVKAGSRGEFETHWEMNQSREVVDDYPDRLRSALSFAVLERYKVVATHEYLSGHDRPATHQLLAGVEARAGRNSTVYSKYAMSRTANDERLGTIMGLRQNVLISPDFKGSFDIEGFRSFSSQSEEEYVALKTGLSRSIKGESLVEGQYEYRWQRAAERHLFRIDALKEFENGVSVLFKDALSIGSYDGRRSSFTTEGRLAGVYRPEVTPVQTLLLIKTQYDKYSPVDPEAIVWTTVVSTDVNVMPEPAHELRFKLAFKRVEDYSLGISETGRNYLVLSQYVYRFARKWDVDVWGRFLGQGSAGTRQTGAGIEIGRVLFDRIRIGAGYSVNGFEDRDMAENEAWEKGFGLRLQLILADWMFNGYRF